MTEKDKRTIELEFYVTIQLLYSIKRDASFLVAILESLRFVVPFNIDKIIYYANQFNLDMTWQPYQGEVLGVLYTSPRKTFSMNALCKAMGISRPTGYTLVKEFLKDEYYTIPKVPSSDIEELQHVVEAYLILRKEVRNCG